MLSARLWAGTPSIRSCTPHQTKKPVDIKPCHGLNFAAWEEELQDDVDRTFILSGIKNGFDIIDPALSLKAIELDNHFSASEASDLYE